MENLECLAHRGAEDKMGSPGLLDPQDLLDLLDQQDRRDHLEVLDHRYLSNCACM